MGTGTRRQGTLARFRMRLMSNTRLACRSRQAEPIKDQGLRSVVPTLSQSLPSSLDGLHALHRLHALHGLHALHRLHTLHGLHALQRLHALHSLDSSLSGRHRLNGWHRWHSLRHSLYHDHLLHVTRNSWQWVIASVSDGSTVLAQPPRSCRGPRLNGTAIWSTCSAESGASNSF